MMLAILTYDELNFLVTAATLSSTCLMVIGFIWYLLSRSDFEDEWCKEQIEYKPMLTYIKKRFGVYGNLTCGKIDGVQWFIYKKGKYIGIYDSEEDTLTK